MRTANLWTLLALSVLLGGCANTETLTAEAAHFGVSRGLLLRAESDGYTPRIDHGKTEFCTHQSSLSYISQQQCLDPGAMQSWLEQRARAAPPSTAWSCRPCSTGGTYEPSPASNPSERPGNPPSR